MGWTIEPKRGKVNLRHYAMNKCKSPYMEPLDCSVVDNVAYVAVKSKSPEYPDHVFCVVLQLYNCRSAIGYKVMSESVGPFYYDAPAKILNLLTEDSGLANHKWRDACRKRINAVENALNDARL